MSTIYTFHNESDLDAVADADQFLVYDASAGRTKSCTALDMRIYMHSGLVNATSSTLTVTQAAHGGAVVTLNRAAGIAVTLPAASGSGTTYTFVLGTTVTSNSTTIKVVGDDIMTGQAIVLQDGGDTMVGFETAADSDTITWNGTTTGGIKGDYVQLVDVAADTWHVLVKQSATGTEATPFSATVS